MTERHVLKQCGACNAPSVLRLASLPAVAFSIPAEAGENPQRTFGAPTRFAWGFPPNRRFGDKSPAVSRHVLKQCGSRMGLSAIRFAHRDRSPKKSEAAFAASLISSVSSCRSRCSSGYCPIHRCYLSLLRDSFLAFTSSYMRFSSSVSGVYGFTGCGLPFLPMDTIVKYAESAFCGPCLFLPDPPPQHLRKLPLTSVPHTRSMQCM